jgi:hypothetical protein
MYTDPFYYAICDHASMVSFQDASNEGSHISASGDMQVPCTSLDDFFRGRSTHLPTMIKIDIEGAENSALIGAKDLITSERPKLSICMYHKIQDMWEIPLTIQQLGGEKGYNFCLRHQMSFFETILFATPKRESI